MSAVGSREELHEMLERERRKIEDSPARQLDAMLAGAP
jgi:hypothetical protein